MSWAFTPDEAGTYVVSLRAADKTEWVLPRSRRLCGGRLGRPVRVAGRRGGGSLESAATGGGRGTGDPAMQAAGLAAAQLAAFRQVQVTIADLPGSQLGAGDGGPHHAGRERGRLRLVRGCGPADGRRRCSADGPVHGGAARTGHVAGLADKYDDPAGGDLMSGWLLPGTRRLPTLADVDAVFGDLARIATDSRQARRLGPANQ